MFTVKLTFYLTLGKEFGREKEFHLEYPLNFFELFEKFSNLSNIKATQFFLDPNYSLKDEYRILLNGRDIFGHEGLKTIINENADIDFFPKLGGG